MSVVSKGCVRADSVMSSSFDLAGGVVVVCHWHMDR